MSHIELMGIRGLVRMQLTIFRKGARLLAPVTATLRRAMIPLLPLCFLAFTLDAQAQIQLVTGTGFYVSSNGYIVTNYHVIQDVTDLRVRDSSGESYPAEVAYKDFANDLAILKVAGNGFSTLPIRSSSEARKGESVFTMGFPNSNLQGPEAKITEGIISSLSGIMGEPNNFQISVAVQPGNSGGPLIDPSGALRVRYDDGREEALVAGEVGEVK